jgi:hypothetical protein
LGFEARFVRQDSQGEGGLAGPIFWFFNLKNQKRLEKKLKNRKGPQKTRKHRKLKSPMILAINPLAFAFATLLPSPAACDATIP